MVDNGLSVDKFIDVLQELHGKIDRGFNKVYKRIDDLDDESQIRLKTCSTRISTIETKLAVRNGVDAENEKRDYWKYFIRAAIVVMTGGSLVTLWKILLANIEIIK